jgi:hypothetical protein
MAEVIGTDPGRQACVIACDGCRDRNRVWTVRDIAALLD